ncbi:GtrA family protein [Luteococcus sp. H138]|uniref:GtrA family protein n=1 Tax=unclassified Luteococcus TaxID=2639923 RepID=UPI00313DBD62
MPSAHRFGAPAALRRLVRFGLVGVANTAVYYLCYRLLLLLLPYLVAHLVAWALSVIFSFFMNCWFTYRVRPTWRRFLGFPLSTVVNLAFTTFGSVILVEVLDFDRRYATLLMGILAIPFTFAVTTVVLTKGVNDPRREQGGAA